jgi:hypothetical protein
MTKPGAINTVSSNLAPPAAPPLARKLMPPYNGPFGNVPDSPEWRHGPTFEVQPCPVCDEAHETNFDPRSRTFQCDLHGFIARAA